MKKVLCSNFIIIISLNFVLAQGFNHQWLLSYNYSPTSPKARMLFDTASYSLLQEQRKMAFIGTEATICDANGNFLMSSNGVWIANANNDTMLNGGGLNPGPFVGLYPEGLLIPYGNIIIPFPGDSLKYILIHQTGSPNNDVPSIELYYSIINLSLDSGMGGVLQKNTLIFQDTISWGIAACRHANGRDWWIFALKDSSDVIYKILFTPNGIANISTQATGVPFAAGNSSQLTFSNNGSHFCFSTYNRVNNIIHNYINIANFDRCNGLLSNIQTVDIHQGSYIFGMAISPNTQYVYAASSLYIYQININSLSNDTVATYDGFYSIYPQALTTFWNIYLAANGKMYITSGNSVQHIHEMNYPDSNGISCDLQQHSIYLGVRNFRGVPNHPNYYLGPVVGSVCDSLTGMDEHLEEIKNFTILPNPNTGNFKICYLLPQSNTSGIAGWFEVYDVMGKQIYKIPLPPWSTLQSIQLPSIPTGIYNAVIRSWYDRVSKKIAVIKE